MKVITQQVIHARKMRNLSQEELAKRIGLPKELIIDLEAGQLDPNVSILLKISSELNWCIEVGNVSI